MDTNHARMRGRITWTTVTWMLIILGIGVGLQLFEEYLKSSMSTSISSDIFPSWITSWDYPVFLAVNTSIHNPMLDLSLNTIMLAGTAIPPLILCALLYLNGRKNEAILLLAAVILGDLTTLSIKGLILRPRPYLIIPSAIHIDMPNDSSFPSGHSMTVFAVATVISNKFSRYVFPAYGLASLVAIGRIYLGVHFPFDVLIGSMIGLASGMVAMRFDVKIESLARSSSVQNASTTN